MPSVVLVDGVGRILLFRVEHARALIEFTPLPEKESKRHWPGGTVIFDLMRDELDPDGRLVYRQRGMGTPDIRWRKTPELPRLRIEGAAEGEGSTGE